MPMNHDELKQALEKLHRDLDAGGTVDPQLRALLQTLDADIQGALRRSDAASSESDSDLSEQVRSLSAKFAADHPFLDNALRNLMDTLAKMGI